MIIEYLTGDAAEPKTISERRDVIVHGCNNKGGWGKGFALHLGNVYPITKEEYKLWFNNMAGTYPFDLGEIQMVPINSNLVVINMITQDGYRGDGTVKWSDSPAKLWAINKGFTLLREYILRKYLNGRKYTIHMPKIGCGLGGLNWKDVLNQIERVFKDYDTDIFYIKVYSLENTNG